jgi:tetratricopeptide (TPR) repeat protein
LLISLDATYISILSPLFYITVRLFKTCAGYHGLNNVEEEENCYDKALEIDPAYAKALFNKATLLQEKGRFEDARSYYNEAVKADPTLESYRSEFIFKKRQSPG